MPKTEETWMDGITTEMMEHICDNLCKYPDQLSGEELEDKCAECKMGRFVCDILNQYNKAIDFENSQCAKLLEQMQRMKERDAAKKVVDQEHFGCCPTCREVFNSELLNEYNITYCPWCGQRLDWSE